MYLPIQKTLEYLQIHSLIYLDVRDLEVSEVPIKCEYVNIEFGPD